jgi:hypothetical protein
MIVGVDYGKILNLKKPVSKNRVGRKNLVMQVFFSTHLIFCTGEI